MKNMKNKWKSWKYDAKYTSVRNRIKRKTNKRERQITKLEIKKLMHDCDW